MGDLISCLLGIFVATIGVSGAASVLDKAVKTTQAYMKESVK
jgi:UDP-N-acetylmuramyl pentapeptide phosphotransferase/UDP-N-acetylglucosamine-1-phosphate transferase